MAKIKGVKYTGPLTVDLSSVAHLLVDVAPGGMKGARGEQEGFDDVKKELASAIPAHGEAANIPLQVYNRFLVGTTDRVLLRDKELELKKLLEILTETRVMMENDGEDDISTMAKAASDTADRAKDPTIAAPFEKTITYNSQIAEKGVQTKRKNAEVEAQKAQKAEAPAASGEPKPPKPGE